MNTDQLQQFLRDYPDGVTTVIYKTQTHSEAWHRNGVQDENQQEFVQTTIENVPNSYDARELLLHFAKEALIINNDKFYLDTFADGVIFLSNDANQNLQRVALTLWTEQKILLGVGCRYGQDGYLQALNMLKNEKLIREAHVRQRQVRVSHGGQMYNLDIVRTPTPLRRKSQHQVFFWFADFKQGVEMLPQLYQIIQQFPAVYFTFGFSQQTKAAIESNLTEYYYLNLINIVECLNQDFIGSLSEQNLQKGAFFFLPAEAPAEQSTDLEPQCDSLFSEDAETILIKLICLLESTNLQSKFLRQQICTEYCQFNMKHSELLGFHGKSLKYVQKTTSQNQADFHSYCLLEVALEDEKSVEYVRSVLALQKKYPETYFAISLRNQFNINKEFLNTIQQKDRSFKELNLVEGFSHTLRAELGEDSEKQPFVGYLFIKFEEHRLYTDVYKELDKLLSSRYKDVERQKEETQQELEQDQDCFEDKAILMDDGLLFRGFRVKPLNVVQSYSEGRFYCICYLDQNENFEKAVEQLYRFKELALECYVCVIVKKISQKSQIFETSSRRAFYLQRLNIFEYRPGFHRFMQRCAAAGNQAIFYGADGSHVPIGGEQFVDPSQLDQGDTLKNLLCDLLSSEQRAVEVLQRKPPQLLQINKPNKGQFVHGGCVFNSSLSGEYAKQKLVLFAFLEDRQYQMWESTISQLSEITTNKICNNIIYCVVCLEKTTAASLQQNYDKFPQLRQLNIIYDNYNICATNAARAPFQVWDTTAMQCGAFSDLQTIQQQYLEAAITEARKNTNVFTESDFVEIHQKQFNYFNHSSIKQSNQQCAFISLGTIDAQIHSAIAQIYAAARCYSDFYFVISLHCSQDQFSQLALQNTYAGRMNVVAHNTESDVSNTRYTFVFSDANGFQQLMGAGREDLFAALLSKSKYKEAAKNRFLDFSHSQSIVADGVQLPYLNKFQRQFATRTVMCLIGQSDSVFEQNTVLMQQLSTIMDKNLYLLVVVADLTPIALQQKLLDCPQLCNYNVLSDFCGFIANQTDNAQQTTYLYINDEDDKQLMQFDELKEKILDKTSRCQLDQSVINEQQLEVTVREKKLTLNVERFAHPRRGNQTLILHFYGPDFANTNDNIYTQFVKQQNNAQNFHIAVFPSDQLLKEQNKEALELQQLLRHYNYLNIARSDVIDCLQLAGQSYVNVNRKFQQCDVQNIDAKSLCQFVVCRPIELHESHVSRLGYNLPYLKKSASLDLSKQKIVLFPLKADQVSQFKQIVTENSDYQFVALVDEPIDDEITQIQRLQHDIDFIAADQYDMIQQSNIDLAGLNFRQPTFTGRIFDYSIDEQCKVQEDELLIQGYQFVYLQKLTTHKDNQQLYFTVLQKDDLQSLIRFCELTFTQHYAFVAIENIDTVEQLQKYIDKFPLAKTLNIIKYTPGMQLLPIDTIFHFDDKLKFAGLFNVYKALPFGTVQEIPKLTFNARPGSYIPKPGDEGYNPHTPVVVENQRTTFSLRDRRYRAHRNKFTNQRIIVWVQGEQNLCNLAKLDELASKGVYVIGGFKEVPVFEDEIKFYLDEIDYHARKAAETAPEEEKKSIEDQKKAELSIPKLNVENIVLVDFEIGPENKLLTMLCEARGAVRELTIDQISKLLPADAVALEKEENATQQSNAAE